MPELRKAIVCVFLGVMVGMLLYVIRVPNPVPPIAAGVIAGTMSAVMRL